MKDLFSAVDIRMYQYRNTGYFCNLLLEGVKCQDLRGKFLDNVLSGKKFFIIRYAGQDPELQL